MHSGGGGGGGGVGVGVWVEPNPQVLPVPHPHTRIKIKTLALAHQLAAKQPLLHTRTGTCVRWEMTVAYNRYKFITVSLPKRSRSGYFRHR